MINVTKTYLPPIEEYEKYLKEIWGRGWITNHGPLVSGLEAKLKEHLGVKHIFFVANGTLALQLAIKVLGLKGEVITTPFSYVATTSSISWEGCEPVFADIYPNTLNINAEEIEKKITDKTCGILGVHVFGNPCEVDKIQAISKKYNLPVIYDAAHAFGVKYKGESILNFGDISTLSFHATKLFHTVEGGAVVTDNDEIAEKINLMRAFGQEGPETILGLGINAKNSELHAAMGLCILPKVKELIDRRRMISGLYDQLFGLGAKISRPLICADADYNFSYYPVIFSSEQVLLNVQKKLKEQGIIPRRYFYPSLNNLNYVKSQSAPVSEDISKRILCLPLFYDLADAEVSRIATIINEAI